MATKTQLKAHFAPLGIKPPPALSELIAFAAKQKAAYSGLFEVALFSARDWFHNDPEAANQFVVFGQNADGGLYAYWLHGGAEIDSAPIVYLGSEGGGVVLADTTANFLRLLAVGVDELGPAVMSGLLVPEKSAGLLAYRTWLKTTLELSAPRNPITLLERAQAKHPNLNDWLEARQRKPAQPAKSSKATKSSKPGRAPPASSVPAKWDDVETLPRLFGLADDDPQLQAFLKQLGKLKVESDTMSKSYIAHDKGLSVHLDFASATNDQRVWGFCLYPGDRKQKPYTGHIPGGLSLQSTRDEVSAKLGKPKIDPGDAIFAPTDTYHVAGYRLVVLLNKKDPTKIESIWVGLPKK